MMTQLNGAILFLVVVAVGIGFWIFSCFRRSPYTPTQTVLYFMNILLTRLLWRAQVPSQLPIPKGQGAVIVSNHCSSVDPFFVQLSAGRVVHWMVASEFYGISFFGWFLKQCETIPAKRGGVDTAATKSAIRLASQGGVIGMFPEGRINMTERFMQQVRPGAAMIALRADVPIIPCWIDGSPYSGAPLSPMTMSARVRVQFGTPIEISAYRVDGDEKGAARRLTLDAVQAIAQLAGQSEFRAELAGRDWKPSRDEIERDIAQIRERLRQKKIG